jgi:hypothetical protein
MSGVRDVLPKDFPIRKRGCCVPAAYIIAQRRRNAMVKTGYVGEYMDEHTWIEHDGEVIDPTIRQFWWFRCGRPIRRVVVMEVPANDFIRQFDNVYSTPSDAATHYQKYGKWIERKDRQ